MQRGLVPAVAVVAAQLPGRGAPSHSPSYCLEKHAVSAYQVGRVDDIRVPVPGHVVRRENYAACEV